MRFRRRFWLVLAVVVLGTGCPVRGADYFVSASGDDAYDGTTPDRCWKTITRASRHSFVAGDKLLFRGGETFAGNLMLKVSGQPTADQPVTVGSFGKGRAMIEAANGTAIRIADVGGVIVRDLVA